MGKEESAPIMQQYLCTKEKFIQIKFLISETLSNDFISYVSKLEQEKISVINEEKNFKSYLYCRLWL